MMLAPHLDLIRYVDAQIIIWYYIYYPTQKSDSINTYIWPKTGTLKTKEILERACALLNFDGNHTLSWLCNPTKVDGCCQNESGPFKLVCSSRGEQ